MEESFLPPHKTEQEKPEDYTFFLSLEWQSSLQSTTQKEERLIDEREVTIIIRLVGGKVEEEGVYMTKKRVLLFLSVIQDNPHSSFRWVMINCAIGFLD